MDTNDHEAQVDAVEDIENEQALEGELPEDSTDWKAEAKRFKGMATRYRNQYLKASEKKVEPASKPEQSQSKDVQPAKNDIGLLEKAFLRSEGIKSAEEIALAQEHMQNTGKSIEEIVDSKFFKAELAELREAAASRAATPSSSRRTTTQATSTVDYWMAKGELPPATPENTQLRREVVNARLKQATNSKKFYNQA